MSTDEMQYVEELFILAREVDSFAAFEKLVADPDPERAALLFGKLSRCFYAQSKDVPRALAVARAGIAFCLGYTGDPEARVRLRQRAKALAYNSGANTWPGWGDEGIRITLSELELGLESARLSLRLTRELSAGPFAESKSHWLIGALLVAMGELEDAATEFERGRDTARLAEQPDFENMNAGYLALIGVLRKQPGASAEFERIVAGLARPEASEDSRFFAQQLKTALTIFEARQG